VVVEPTRNVKRVVGVIFVVFVEHLIVYAIQKLLLDLHPILMKKYKLDVQIVKKCIQQSYYLLKFSDY
jgi:hypothetical protein